MRRLCVLAVLLVAVLAACGPGAGSDADRPTDVELVVSRDFGNRQLGSAQADEAPAGETVMRFLERNFDEVQTRYGGGFVQTLEGLSGGEDARGRPLDWFFYVNGVESSQGAADYTINPGDRIWWDRHDWGAAQRVPAVVGAWPEPFVNGYGGNRFPLTLACAGEERTCDEVEERLSDAGVERISRTALSTANGMETLRILVGPWSELTGEAAASQLERGPGASGVYAVPRADEFDLLDETGAVVATRGAGTGLVAATACCDQRPTWVVTGVDDAGVAAAAAALRPETLRNRFAVAVVGGRTQALPIRAER